MATIESEVSQTAARKSIEKPLKKWGKRIGWLVAIWCLSVLSLGLAATLMRALMTAAGMSSGS